MSGRTCRRPAYYNITFCPEVQALSKGRDSIENNGKKKMGRPVIGEPKNKRISLRATETTATRLQQCSDALKKSKTDLLEEMVEKLYQSIKK